MENRIVVILHGNEDMITLGVTAKLCDYHWTYSPPADEELSEKFLSFRNSLQDLSGVKEIHIGKHEVRIERYEAFMWDEIIPGCVAILAKYAEFPDYIIRLRDNRPTHEYGERGERGSRLYNPPVDIGIPNVLPFHAALAAE